MRTANFRERAALAAMLAVTILASFRNKDADLNDHRPLPLLEGINSQASTMLISYNQRNVIGRLTRIQRASEDTYTDVRIPVYKNGRLASTLVSGHTNGEDSEIFSSFEYTTNYPLIDKIRYYTQGQVQGYDSLVYNAAAQIVARYSSAVKQITPSKPITINTIPGTAKGISSSWTTTAVTVRGTVLSSDLP